jgi:hypothetical protein
MCVILEKKIGSEIPFEALLRGSTRNPDGYGVSVIDRGEMTVFTGLAEKSEVHAEEVQKILEQAKDLPTMVHFRYATAGKRTVANTHPFSLLTKKEHGVDVSLMHNGTMPFFKIEGSDESDTARFVFEVAKPLFIRAWKYHEGDEEQLMDDHALQQALKAMVGHGVLTLQSSNGSLVKVNGFFGQDYDWGWASNKNPLIVPQKEEKKVYPAGATTPWYGRENASTWKAKADERDSNALEQGEAIKDMVRLSPFTTFQLPEPRHRLDSKDFLKPFELSDLVWLDLEDIRDMVYNCPEATATVLMDLLFELYQKNNAEKAKPVSSALTKPGSTSNVF